MSCAHPVPALDLGFKINDSGEQVRNIKLLDMKFKYYGYGIEELKAHFGEQLILLPCGNCFSCCCDYSRMWASRIMLEASHHEANCFITLTYSDENLPNKLEKRPLQLFFKRLRKAVGKLRYFACGELGEKKGIRKDGNPHYHAVIFGYDFPDKVFLKRSGSGMMIYRSPLLEEIWPFGMSSIGTVSPESAQYVAKYSMKRKLSGEDSGEFVLMSRRPGIGIDSYDEDIWLTDKLYISGKTYKPPRYFEKIAQSKASFLYVLAKDERLIRGKARVSEKFLYGLEREEDALRRANEQKIFESCLKVRKI